MSSDAQNAQNTQRAMVPATGDREAYLAKVAHVRMGLAPTNLEEGFRLADVLSKSSLVPKEFQGSPGNTLIAIQLGMEIGLSPAQALQSIAVINGKPSLYGDGMLAVVMGSGMLESIDEPPVEAGVASCTVKRRGWAPRTRTFSEADAKKAGLWAKSGPWQQYPNRMLQMRARAFALRDLFPDVLRGIASAEEQADVVAVSVEPERPAIQPPQRKPAAVVDATPLQPEPVDEPTPPVVEEPQTFLDPPTPTEQAESLVAALEATSDAIKTAIENKALDAELANDSTETCPITVKAVVPKPFSKDGKFGLYFEVVTTNNRSFRANDPGIGAKLAEARETKARAMVTIRDGVITSCVLSSQD